MTAVASKFDRLSEIVADANVALLADFGVALRPAAGAAPERGRAVAASIGFSHPAARGTLTFFAPSAGAMAFWPAETQISPTPEAMRDLFGEIANMVLGRVKLRLLAHDVVIMLTTPVAWTGGEVEVETAWGGFGRWLVFASDKGSLFVRLDVVLDEHFELGEARDLAIGLLLGEPILF